jgi:DNA-binding XRE family transcriptional regulator
MYTPFHEAGEDNFVCALDEMMSKEPGYKKLAFQRKVVGYSQRKLAQKAGVNLRTLQQYESGAKDLNKASVETVLNLAWALGCDIEDILYRRFD